MTVDAHSLSSEHGQRTADLNLSLSHQIRNRLRSEIHAMKHLPREQLCVGDIAARMRASTTPVREALLYLVGEGLVDFKQNRGFSVKPLSLRSTIEHYRLCEAIILHRVSLFTFDRVAAPDGDIVQLDPTLGPEENAKDVERFYLSLFCEDMDNETISILSRSLAATNVVRKLILENSPSRDAIVETYTKATVALSRRAFDDVANNVRAAIRMEERSIEPAVSTMIARYML